MSERPFMQLYVSDFVGDTMHLSVEQVGAYLLLLMAMWNADGTLPNSEAKLARIAKSSVETWREMWADLAPYFEVEGDKITHGRLAKELAKFARKSAARSDAGKRGAAAKALKSNKPGQAIAVGLPKHSPETRIKKGRATLSDPTERTVRLDRRLEPELFARCVEITGETVKDFIEHKTFSVEVVAQAQRHGAN